jgi:hypothetical protein
MSHGTGHFEEQITPQNNKDSVPTSQTTRYASLETQIIRALANGKTMVAYCENYTKHKNGKNSASCADYLLMKIWRALYSKIQFVPRSKQAWYGL